LLSGHSGRGWDLQRRKIIAGAIALEHMQRDLGFGQTMRGLLDRYVDAPIEW
jgi:hypothetical protein